MPSDENKNSEKKGFSGLSSLVSDISSIKNSSAPPTIESSHSESRESATRQQQPPKSESETKDSGSKSTPSSSGGIETSTVVWIIGLILFILFITTSNKEKPAPQSAPNEYDKLTRSPTQPQSTIAPLNEYPPVQPLTNSRFTVDIPPVGDSLTHSPAQLRYCAAERIRLDAAETIIDNYSTIDVDKFNAMVKDYNSRCGRFRYRSGNLENAKSEVEKYRSELEAEGRNRFNNKSGQRLDSRSSAPPPPKPDANIMEIQRRLNEFGYSVGIPDGLNGPATKAAVSEFQKDQGLPVTGIGSLDMFRQARVVVKSPPTPPPPNSTTTKLNSSTAIQSGTPQTSDENTPKILGAAFGVMTTDQNGKSNFRATDVVPLTTDQSYGWYIKLENSKATVRWREELTVPYPPRIWGTSGSNASHTISPDGRTLITSKSVTPVNGLIFNFWAVADGDPIGLHTLKVFVEDQHVRTFVFSANKQ